MRASARSAAVLMVCVFTACVFMTNPAHAHAHLRTAVPEASATGPSPPRISLGFSDALEPRLSRIAVTAGATTIAEGVSPSTADDPRRMVLELPKLAPGTYTVKWTAVSIDTHRTEGSYSFTVAP
jgi:methionine-rich copper-binding protein CopC